MSRDATTPENRLTRAAHGPIRLMETIIMRKFIVPAFIALLAVAPGAAFAATTTATAPAVSTQGDQTVSGKIGSVNLIARSLVMADGTRYFLPLDFKDPGLKAGEQVTVHWKMNGTAHDVTSVTIG
jgi:hypothetical protein